MPRVATSPAPDTATRALDAAERLVQQMGFNWFSYADIAEALGIRKASLHHHFPTKADLGCALIVRYRDIRSLFELNRKWLASILRQGQRSRLFPTRDTPESASLTLLGALEGSMLIARPFGDVAGFTESAAQILQSLKVRT